MLKGIKIIKSLIVSVVLFSILFSCFYTMTTNRLNGSEYEVISNMYSRMRAVDSSIKNDFYVEKGLKILDRKIISEQLKGDSIVYCLSISNNIMEMIKLDRDKKYIKDYIGRCDLAFDKVVGLETADELYDTLYQFNLTYIPDEEYLQIFGDDLVRIVEKGNEEIKHVATKNKVYASLICLCYILLFIFSYIFIVDKITLVNIKKIYTKLRSKIKK